MTVKVLGKCRCWDSGGPATVAIKVLVKKQWCQPVMTMAEIMMVVDHPNINLLLQVIENKTRIYLAMVLVEGQELYKYIQKVWLPRAGKGQGNIYVNNNSHELLP